MPITTHQKHYFNAARYHGDETGGCLEWTWEIHHRSDFLGLPADGKTTLVRGMTIHAFRDGKIILERSLWDTAALMRQLGLQRSEEHTSELQSLMRTSYAVFCLTKKKTTQ